MVTCIPRWNDLIRAMVSSGTTSFLRANHSASLGTKSYAFFKSMKVRKTLDLCSYDFSTSWRTVKIISAQLRAFLNPHCDSSNSSSATFCSLTWSTLATTLPTTSSKEMPRQLSQLLRSPFLGMGSRIASRQSLGTLHCLHTSCTSSIKADMNVSSQHAAFTISGSIPVEPPALLPFNFPTAAQTSPSDGSRGRRGDEGRWAGLETSTSGSSEGSEVRNGKRARPGDMDTESKDEEDDVICLLDDSEAIESVEFDTKWSQLTHGTLPNPWPPFWTNITTSP